MNNLCALGSSKCEKSPPQKKTLDVWKKSPTHKSSFWTSQKVVQVAGYRGFKKPYKTCLKLIFWCFEGAFGGSKCEKS